MKQTLNYLYALCLCLSIHSFNIHAQTYSIGQTPLSVSVGGSGQVNSRIPIFCSPGRLGQKPEITLSINSSTESGLIGQGGNIGGLSAICRTGTNYHLNNGRQEAISFTAADEFSLDGNRLMLISGSYGVANSTYRTEADQFCKVVYTGSSFIVYQKGGGVDFYGNQNNSSFTPTGALLPLSYHLYRSYDRLGNFMEYSYQTSSGQVLPIQINYTGFDASINGLQTSSSSFEAPTNKIVFSYEEKMNPGFSYISGAKIEDKYRLKTIQSLLNLTTLVRKYTLTYTSSTEKNLLSKLSEENGNGELMPPVNFNWSEPSGPPLTYSSNKSTSTLIPGNFTGDGKSKVLAFKGKINHRNGELLRAETNTFTNSPPLYGIKTTIYNPLPNPITNNINSSLFTSVLNEINNISDILVADLNNDGIDDILFQTTERNFELYDGFNGFDCLRYFKFLGANYHYHALMMSRNLSTQTNILIKDYYKASIFDFSSNSFIFPKEKNLYQFFSVRAHLADLDGDGSLDLVEEKRMGNYDVAGEFCGSLYHFLEYDSNNPEYADKTPSEKFDAIFNDQRFNDQGNSELSVTFGKSKNVKLNIASANSYMEELQVIDMNGDGRSDLMYLKSNHEIEVLNWNNEQLAFNTISSVETYPNAIGKLNSGDFNGDGLSDILYLYEFSTNYQLNCQLSTGIGFGNIQSFGSTPLPLLKTREAQLCLGDFNGDGKTDILTWIGNSYKKLFSHSSNSSFSSIDLSLPIFITVPGYYASYDATPVTSDLNGDGITDFITHYGVFCFANTHNELQSIANRKETHSFKFESLNSSGSYSVSGKMYGGQTLILNNAIRICVEKKFLAANVLAEQINYYYKDFIYHRHGRGPLGFGSIAQQNITTGYATLEDRRLSDLHDYRLVPEKIYSYRNAAVVGNFLVGSNLLSDKVSETNQLFPIDGNNNIYFAYLAFSTETDYVKKTVHQTCFEYDENGNLTLSKERFSKLEENAKAEFISNIHYTYATYNSWLPASLIKEESYHLRFDDNQNKKPFYTQSVNYTYASNGNLSAKINFANTPSLYLRENYEYDVYGNKTQQSYTTSAASAAKVRQQSYTYLNGQWPATSTNSLNQTTTYTFEPIFGNKLSEITSFGQTTSYQYDSWGRLSKEISPNGNFVQHNLEYGPSTGTDAFDLAKKTTTNLGSFSYEYFDNLGNKIFALKSALGSNTAKKVWVYNSKNQVISESNWFNPTDLSATKRMTDFVYDSYDRLNQLKKQNNVLKTISYENNTSTTSTFVQEGKYKVQKRYFTATGNLQKIVDNGSVVTEFELGSHNKNLSITSEGNTTTFSYNQKLNPLSTTEASIGTKSFTYNTFGQTLTETDQKGITVSYEYDANGILTRKQSSTGEEYTYQYFTDPTKASVNQLKKEEYLENKVLKNKIEYSYTTSGELSMQTELAANGTSYTCTYDYDANHRLATINYPSLSISNVYDASNNVTEKYLNQNNTSSRIWKLNSTLPDGRTQQMEYGNGLVTDYTYNSNDLAPQRIYAHQNQTAILDYYYTFASNLLEGNVIGRSDAKNGNTEAFEYDEFDRLSNITLAPNSPNALAKPHNYESTGNLIQKPEAGEYVYDGGQPYTQQSNEYLQSLAPSQINASLEQSQSIGYTYLNKIKELNQETKTLKLDYGVSGQRIKMEISDNGISTNTTYYIPTASLEIVNGDEITYIYANGNPIAMHRSSTNALTYFTLDLQGSLLALTDNAGNLVAERNYDAWGRPRNPATLAYTLANPFGGSSSNYTLRGYTFHEHLEEFDLINMNGRMYDTHLAKFLNADPLLQDYENSQNYNRYSYVLNNPLKYTDPSGYASKGYTIPNVGEAWEANGRIATESYERWSWSKKSIQQMVKDAFFESEGGGAGGAIGNQNFYLPNISGTYGIRGNSNANFVANYLEFRAVLNHNSKLFDSYFNHSLGSLFPICNDKEFIVYKNPHNIYANYKIFDLPTLINTSNSTIWLKPENNNLEPISLAPGNSTSIRIDGITHPSRPGQVLKVVSGFDVLFGIEANNNGVSIGQNNFLWPLPNELNILFGGGWLTIPPDNGWDEIFKRAGYSKP
ncbi:MAG: hypothetical protein CFE21_10555 [Bacteroidetes bacterium B1(2017)]|nr:MAG: hypothetical protein CFE21_10555 [Bacteroidetes bacterium B1(2017)]